MGDIHGDLKEVRDEPSRCLGKSSPGGGLGGTLGGLGTKGVRVNLRVEQAGGGVGRATHGSGPVWTGGGSEGARRGVCWTQLRRRTSELC